MVLTGPAMQSLWIGSELSPMESLCINSFLKNGHPFHLYIYDEVSGIPAGTTIFDASTVVSRDRIFKYKDNGSYAGFSNLFRYRLLLEKGGYWVDTDVVCLKPFEHPDTVFATERIKGQKTIKAANCVMRAPAGAELVQFCFQVADKADPDKLTWGVTGPELLTFAVEKFKAYADLAPPHVFCPVNYWDWRLYIDESAPTDLLAQSDAAHLWHEMWRRDNLSKYDDQHPDSLYEGLKRRYSKA